MSELINTDDNRATIRWKLLASASALALLGSACAAEAAGSDADRPVLWIELGGQMDSVSGQGAPFTPDFLTIYSDSPILHSPTPVQVQKPSRFGFGEYGKISFQPEGSDWIFSAAIRYGRSSNLRHVDHQSGGFHYEIYNKNTGAYGLFTDVSFADTKAHNQESHAILDFAAGKDIGLGMLGRGATSTLNLGVRFAHFASSSSVDMRARPDLLFKYIQATPSSAINLPYFHGLHATGHASRSFRGVGPSLSWSGSAPFVGNQQDGEIEFDWGVNAALLFGKQKAHVRHQETGYYHSIFGDFFANPYPVTYHNPSRGHDANRSVTVPNVGGFVGVSWRVENFKVSFGYRGDFFFGAMDGGIDARKSETLGFKGPFASISVGLGD